PAAIATPRRLLSRDLLGPGFIGTGNMLHLLAKRAHAFELSLRRFERPFVLRHGFRQGGEILLDALPDKVDRVRDVLRFGWTLLCDPGHRLHEQCSTYEYNRKIFHGALPFHSGLLSFEDCGDCHFEA